MASLTPQQEREIARHTDKARELEKRMWTTKGAAGREMQREAAEHRRKALEIRRLSWDLGLLGSTFLHGPFDAKNREAALRKMVEAQKEAMRAEAAADAAPDSAKLATEAAEAAAVVEEQEEEVSPAERVLIERMAAKEAAAERVIEQPAERPAKKAKKKSSTRVTAKAGDSPAVVAITERYRTWRKALGRGDVEEAESAYTDIRNSIDDDKVEPRWSAKQRAAFNRWTPPRRCGWGMLGSIFRR
jgi:hypothetical protein